jgi:Ser/Thr protein kinase RdoA (MazF antagonist)
VIAYINEIAVLALRYFALPENCSVQLINISENATFKIEAPQQQRWALRVHRKGYHSREAIASELAWLMALRHSGVAITPKPVAGLNGDIIQTVVHPKMGQRHVVLSQWEAGREPGIGEDLQRPFEILGELTAHMHAHAKHWKRPDYFQRFTWNFETSLGNDNPHWGQWQNGLGMNDERKKLFTRTIALIAARLNAYGKSNQRFGLIHGDLRLANLLLEERQVKVIDFDDCGFGWYMYDAATPISFHEHEPQIPNLIEAWKHGYRKAAPLSAEDEIEIPTFIMLRRLLLVAWIGSHSETNLAKSMGVNYTETTDGLCETYLSKFS